MLTLAIGEDNLIVVGTSDRPLRLSSDDSILADATITAQLKSEDFSSNIGDQVTVSPDVTAGIYEGTLLAATPLVQDTYYWLEVTISGSGTGFRRIKCQAQYHAEEP